MYPVTEAFNDAMAAPERRILGKVVIDYTSPFLDQSIEVDASEQARTSYPAQTADGITEVPYKWASLDGSWVLDGTYHLMPGPAQAHLYQVGWWAKQLAGAGGVFVSPYPTLVVRHHPRPVHSLRVVGDNARMEWPVDFTIRLYDENDVLLHTETVTGNQDISWSLPLSTAVLDVAKQELQITRWSHEGRQAKVIEFFTSVQQTYEAGDLLEINLLEEREVGTGALPVGSISSNEIAIRLRNDNRQFDADNAQSPLYRLLMPNRRIRAWLGLRGAGDLWGDGWYAPFDRDLAVARRDGAVLEPLPGYVATLRPGEGRFGGAVAVEEGTTNLIPSPRWFRDSRGQSPDWCQRTVYSDHHWKVEATGTANDQYEYYYPWVQNVTPDTEYTFSFRVRQCVVGHEIEVRVRPGNNQTPNLIERHITAADVGKIVSLTVNSGDNTSLTPAIIIRVNTGQYTLLEISDIQFEAKPFPTSFVDGTRAGGVLTYPASVVPANQGTVSLWVLFPQQFDGAIGGWARIFTNGNQSTVPGFLSLNGFRYNLSEANILRFMMRDDAGNAYSINTDKPPAGWHHVAITWNANEMALYVDGEKKASRTDHTVPSAHPFDWIAIGARADNYDHINTLLDELLILPYAASDEIIADLYRQTRPLYDEWVPLGTYWSTEWQAPSDTVEASVIARDRLELLRKSTYQTSHVRIGWDLCDLATDVLLDAGLTEGEDFFVCPSLKGIHVPYAWFEPVSHREALRLIAEAALGTVYCDRDGRIVVHTIHDLGQDVELEIGPDNYFRADNPMRPGEVANEVIVDTQPLRPVPTPEEVYRSDEPVNVPAGQTRRITAFYNERPVIEAVATLGGATNTVIQQADYYGWGAEITLYNPGTADEEVTITIEGRPLRVLNRERAIARDETSITELGVLRFELEANPLIQTRQVAQQLADLILASSKDSRRDLEMEWRGNPALLLGDKIKVKGGEYHVIRSDMTWRGGLRASTVGRRASE